MNKSLYILALIISYVPTHCGHMSQSDLNKRSKLFTDVELYEMAEKFKIPSDKLYSMGLNYYSFIYQNDTLIDWPYILAHSSAYNVLYFNEEGKITSAVNNAERKDRLHPYEWRKLNVSSSFPPDSDIFYPVLNRDYFLSHIVPLSKSSRINTEVDYLVIVNITLSNSKHCRKFVNRIKSNLKYRDPQKSIEVIYVSQDNLIINHLLECKQRKL